MRNRFGACPSGSAILPFSMRKRSYNASGYATKRALAPLGDEEDEVTLAKYLVHAFIYDRLTFGGKSL